jgi:hypothetical protein
VFPVRYELGFRIPETVFFSSSGFQSLAVTGVEYTGLSVSVILDVISQGSVWKVLRCNSDCPPTFARFLA